MSMIFINDFVTIMLFTERVFFLLNPYNTFEITSQPGVAYEIVSYKHEIIFPLEFILVFNSYINKIILSKKYCHW